MKKIILNLLLLFVIAFASQALAGRNCNNCPAAKGMNSTNSNTAPANAASVNCQCGCLIGNETILSMPLQDISDTEKADLILMREEEKLARDVYEFLYEKWAIPIFKNISLSEQRHTDSVKTLLTKYGIQDPVTSDQRGVFVKNEFQALYNDLIKKGSNSLADALQVGATIEDLDIKDLKKAVMLTDNDDIKLVYNNLTSGSRNHLRAFVTQIKAGNATYTAKYLTQAEVDEIVNSPRERNCSCPNCACAGCQDCPDCVTGSASCPNCPMATGNAAGTANCPNCPNRNKR